MKKKIFITAVVLSAFLSINVYAMVNSPKPTQNNDERNLKVLPKDISNDDLKEIMKFYSKSLGVKCSHCHVANPDNPKEIDFASDENHHKETARYMMMMTQKINDDHFSPYTIDEGKVIVPNQINCMTCHNGQAKPYVTEVPQKED